MGIVILAKISPERKRGREEFVRLAKLGPEPKLYNGLNGTGLGLR
jgi:hypothetical protein